MSTAKTGALLGCAASIGAILAGAPLATVRALRDFGRHLGVAFQAIDDLLGIWGDPATTGKPVGNDIRQRKKSMPIVAALAAGDDEAKELGRSAVRCQASVGASQRGGDERPDRQYSGVPPLRQARHQHAGRTGLGTGVAEPLVPGRGHPGHLAGGSVRGPRVDRSPGEGAPRRRPRLARTCPPLGRTPPRAGRPRRLRGGARVVSLLADDPGTARDEPGATISGRNGLSWR